MINYLKKFVLASSFVAIATGSSAETTRRQCHLWMELKHQ